MHYSDTREHCRDTCGLGLQGSCGGWALQGYLRVRHCRENGAAGILGNLMLERVTLKSQCENAKAAEQIPPRKP